MSSPHINAPIQARMYTKAMHRVIWVVAVVASAGLLAPPLFFIAAKKRVATMAVPAVYAVIIYGSAVLGSLLGNPKNWVGGALSITMIIAAVHASILDADRKQGR
ncbi:hypothetical protein PV689_01870 [Streptomyces sp. ATCC51928]|uniref:Uncharacterized protein n=1 Tax=Streptomyces caviscabies TaxID=90079 RepID=A0ABW2MI64_9ACTN|nr:MULTISPECIES: hypothetical protein [Streptomyces]MDX2669264.1 hypothetical protein [Streptomyces sp. NRRL_ISP-5395]MDX3337160.1 hypothetical protein [Streptomyces sp. ME02-6979.5a]MDX3500658.1 hypothetical protein [Streptomyces sp. ATCC51928]MDX5520719.1 hypothetical protein [Streptomyces sp. DE06-01C]WKN16114.1 hypothetical protein NEH83_19205 [Streptomyces sp. JUS-F4]